MDYSGLSTSSINKLITQYKNNEINRRIQPMQTKVSKYKSSSSAYGTLSSKLGGLKSMLETLKSTGTESIFINKKAATSNTSFLTASATSTASIGSSSLRVNQLAKNDIVISNSIDTSSTSANDLGYTDGNYKFQIFTGSDLSSQFVSTISVDINASDSNAQVLEKIKDAINIDSAKIDSNTKVGSDSYAGGTTSFTIDVGGTETTISDSTATTYEELIDSIVNQINTNVDGITAEKVVDGSNVSFNISSDNASTSFSINHASGYDLVTDFGITTNGYEKAASSSISASVFSSETGKSQLSLTSKESGLDYRITNISDSGGTALGNIGLNLGSARTEYNQTAGTSGFIYSDITSANNMLNSKLTFNGLAIQRNTNTIDDLVSGVTLSLTSVMSASDNDVNLNVTHDTDSIKKEIESFVTKFNDVYNFIKNNSLSENGVRGAFVGDSTATNIRIKLSGLSYSEVSGLSDTEFNKLSSIGITFSSTSGLSISDSSLLETSLTNNIDEVENLFNSDNGIANQFYNFVEPYLESTGYLSNIQNSYDSSVTYLNDRITSTQGQIDKSSTVLRSRYEDLQKQLLIILNSQSLYNSIASNAASGFF